jgi:hypothetical protein
LEISARYRDPDPVPHNQPNTGQVSDSAKATNSDNR